MSASTQARSPDRSSSPPQWPVSVNRPTGVGESPLGSIMCSPSPSTTTIRTPSVLTRSGSSIPTSWTLVPEKSTPKVGATPIESSKATAISGTSPPTARAANGMTGPDQPPSRP